MKLIKLEPLEEGVYVNPEVPEIFKYAQEWIESVGCSEVAIILKDGENYWSEIFVTSDRSESFLGTLKYRTDEYSQELQEYEAED